MTSRSVLGGDKLTGSLHRRSTRDNLQQFKTWSSIDQDLAPSLYPQGAKASSRSHGTRGKSDRASFPARASFERSKLSQALIDVAFLLYIAVFLSSVASAFGLIAYAVYLRVIS